MDWHITFEMAALSLASYEDSSEAVSEWYDDVIFFRDEATSTEAYLARGDGIRVIAIRGTDSKRDWYWNLAFGSRKCNDGQHHGFAKSADLIMNSDAFREFSRWSGPIYMTGHSKGGSIALIMALKMQQEVNSVYCFGCPRAGNRTFRKEYLKKGIKTNLFRNRFDVVSLLPPIIMGYIHVVKTIKTDSIGHDMNEYFDWVSKKTDSS